MLPPSFLDFLPNNSSLAATPQPSIFILGRGRLFFPPPFFFCPKKAGLLHKFSPLLRRIWLLFSSLRGPSHLLQGGHLPRPILPPTSHNLLSPILLYRLLFSSLTACGSLPSLGKTPPPVLRAMFRETFPFCGASTHFFRRAFFTPPIFNTAPQKSPLH